MSALIKSYLMAFLIAGCFALLAWICGVTVAFVWYVFVQSANEYYDKSKSEVSEEA